MAENTRISRRHILQGLSIAAGSGLAVPALAGQLILTPRQSLGPFYPLTLPLDADNDLIQVQGRKNPAKGQVAHISGRVLHDDGRPVAGARVEIWQCDASGRYHHPGDGARADPDFQGFGHAITDAKGAYRFRTLKPMPYTGRAPHIHFSVQAGGLQKLVTQMYLAGHPLNKNDFLLRGIANQAARNSLLVDVRPVANLEPGALAGTFDIVVGGRA